MKTQSLLKKCMVVLALFFGLIGMTNLNAQEFTVGDLNYRINDDGVSVTVTGHVDGYNATGELIIPESVNYGGNEYPVTIIGDQAFGWCSGLTGSLTIPNSVVEIGAYAFDGCRGLDGSLILSNSLNIIGNNAFCWCDKITGSLVIPNSVVSIGDYSFEGCQKMTGALVIPNSVTTIGVSAFEWCYRFTSLYISESVININGNPFAGCRGFEEIVVANGNPIYDSRNNCNAIIETSSNELIKGCQNTIIPEDVTSIGSYAFYSSSYGNINIPNSVTAIHDYAFTNNGISSVFIPSSVDYIGYNPFSDNASLNEIIVDSQNPVYDSRNNCNAIIKTSSLELVSGCKNTTMPEIIMAIGNSAFSGCTYSDSIALTIPNSVISIGDGAFYGCSGLKGSLVIPNSVNYIGEMAFGSCHGFSGSLVIGSSVTEIGTLAFEYCDGFTEIATLATEPPLLGYWGVFDNFGCTTLTVPCGCIPAYQYSDWSQYFTTFIEDCSDVEELEENLASVYPNPTSNIVKIEAENIQNISIYNMLGEMVFESSASGDVFEYDFSNNESGVYIVRIETAQGVVTKRVTVR